MTTTKKAATKSPPPSLRCLDLFSGIGGFARGLRYVCSTAAFCDTDPTSCAVLSSNPRLRGVPVLPDVKRVDRAKLIELGRPSMLAGGFPCQDISSMKMTRDGQGRGGIDAARSGLFFEIPRIVRASGGDVKHVLLENSPNIITSGDSDRVVEELQKVGLTHIAYGVFAATDVGAHHMRRRWFLLASSAPAELPLMNARDLRAALDHPWDAPIPRVVPRPADARLRSAFRRRLALLGNSVVPQVVALAYQSLATALRDAPPTFREAAPTRRETSQQQQQQQQRGSSSDGAHRKSTSPLLPLSKHVVVVVADGRKRAKQLLQQQKAQNQNQNQNAQEGPPAEVRNIIPRPRLAADPPRAPAKPLDLEMRNAAGNQPKRKLTQWMTPRHQAGWHQNRVLTERAMWDLANGIYYEVGTRAQCPALRDIGGDVNHMSDVCVVNPHFVENLMGYPPDWTKTPGDVVPPSCLAHLGDKTKEKKEEKSERTTITTRTTAGDDKQIAITITDTDIRADPPASSADRPTEGGKRRRISLAAARMLLSPQSSSVADNNRRHRRMPPCVWWIDEGVDEFEAKRDGILNDLCAVVSPLIVDVVAALVECRHRGLRRLRHHHRPRKPGTGGDRDRDSCIVDDNVYRAELLRGVQDDLEEYALHEVPSSCFGDAATRLRRHDDDEEGGDDNDDDEIDARRGRCVALLLRLDSLYRKGNAEDSGEIPASSVAATSAAARDDIHKVVGIDGYWQDVMCDACRTAWKWPYLCCFLPDAFGAEVGRSVVHVARRWAAQRCASTVVSAVDDGDDDNDDEDTVKNDTPLGDRPDDPSQKEEENNDGNDGNDNRGDKENDDGDGTLVVGKENEEEDRRSRGDGTTSDDKEEYFDDGSDDISAGGRSSSGENDDIGNDDRNRDVAEAQKEEGGDKEIGKGDGGEDEGGEETLGTKEQPTRPVVEDEVPPVKVIRLDTNQPHRHKKEKKTPRKQLQVQQLQQPQQQQKQRQQQEDTHSRDETSPSAGTVLDEPHRTADNGDRQQQHQQQQQQEQEQEQHRRRRRHHHRLRSESAAEPSTSSRSSTFF